MGVGISVFAQRVVERLNLWQAEDQRIGQTDVLVERAVVHEYCRLLHGAISMEGTTAQTEALAEISDYITPIIRRLLEDDASAMACVNDVLTTIWTKHHEVGDPGNFLAWAAAIAGHSARNERDNREMAA